MFTARIPNRLKGIYDEKKVEKGISILKITNLNTTIKRNNKWIEKRRGTIVS